MLIQEKIKICKGIVERFQGKILPEEEHKIILEILKNHHEFEKKLNGYELKAIKVGKMELFKITWCFFLIRTDNIEVSISYRIATTKDGGKRDCDVRDQLKAMRNEINDQIKEFNNCANNIVCEICKFELSKETEIDHIKPFRDIVKEWGKSVKTVNYLFEDREEAKDWQKFHQTHATMRRVCAKCNRDRK
jgi:hypothetical protein